MKFNRIVIPCALFLVLSAGRAFSQSSGRQNFDDNWNFHLGDIPGAEKEGVNDKNWEHIDLPHDWSITGKFSAANPAGANGGALPDGLGWYHKHFSTPAEKNGKRLSIEFDGVYKNSSVWINGHYLGLRPYGFSSFIYDLSPYLHAAGQQNMIAVKVDNSAQPNSRWYSGSGIFRHVWIIQNHDIQIAPWRSVISPVIEKGRSSVHMESLVVNHSGQRHTLVLTNQVISPSGKLTGTSHTSFTLGAGDSIRLRANMVIAGALSWDVLHPDLYTLHAKLTEGAAALDTYTEKFGFRTIRFDADSGFYLNGRRLKILGVCDHHDLGCLGAAFNDRAMERKLQILKSAGVNALRTSHNPPAPELLDLCDRMGILVMDESFDHWAQEKTKYDYHLDYAAWHERDLSDLILRDRNHASIIMWSIGNEIPEQGLPQGGKMAAELAAIVRKYDTTRFITSACDNIVGADKNGFADALDVAGINYHIFEYDKQHKQFPLRRFIGSETASALSSRGVYHMSADSNILKAPDLLCSSYDNCVVAWGSSAEDGWKAVKDRAYMSGTFVWTGFDYIGEPTPFDYPAHTSYFGFIDLCGFPKDGYYMYRSQWVDKPLVHLLPHWNWTPGQLVDVWAYTNCEEVRLFLNGKPLGAKLFADQQKFHVSWKVPFEAGKLLAIGYRKGVEISRDSVQTAGAPYMISLSADRSRIHAGGKDLSYITVKVLDKNGVMVPDAASQINFTVSGAGSLAGVDNGNEISLESFKDNKRKAFNGMALLVVRGSHAAGKISVVAGSVNLKSASLNVITN